MATRLATMRAISRGAWVQCVLLVGLLVACSVGERPSVRPFEPPTGTATSAPLRPVDFRCMSARAVSARSESALTRFVVPPDLPSSTVTPSSPAALVRRALLNVDRYALSSLYPRMVLGALDPRMHSAGPRAASGEALALAVTLATGAYDPVAVGQPVDRARAVATWLVGSYACGHAAVTAGGWGAGSRPIPADLHQWQTPLWAAQLGAAGWLLWPDLGEHDRYDVAAMVVNEADRIAAVAPNYYARPDGRVLFPGDTKAEEDAWIGTIFTLAAAMMPSDPHAALWRRQEATYEIAAYATAADTMSDTVVNGRALRSWLAGWNIFPDGTVVNHGLNPHPDYMAMVSLNLSAAAIDAAAQQTTPRAALHNAALVYRALLSRRFASPPYRAPGGTIYRPHSATIYYPVGDDWGTSLTAHFVLLDAEADALGLSADAADYLALHAAGLLSLQARGTDGQTYQATSEYRYPDREQWVAEQVSRAWLIEWASTHHRLRISDEAIP